MRGGHGLAGIRCHAREVNDLFTNTRLCPARIRLPFNAYTHDDDRAKSVTMRVTEIIIDVCLIPLPHLREFVTNNLAGLQVVCPAHRDIRMVNNMPTQLNDDR